MLKAGRSSSTYLPQPEHSGTGENGKLGLGGATDGSPHWSLVVKNLK